MASRFQIQFSRFFTTLSPYLRELYGVTMERELKPDHHPDTEELLNIMLGFLPFSTDEVMGFLHHQAQPLVAISHEVCSKFTNQQDLPSARLLVCDKRYIKLNTHPMAYDTSSNQQVQLARHPLMVVSFDMVVTYAQFRAARKSEPKPEAAVSG